MNKEEQAEYIFSGINEPTYKELKERIDKTIEQIKYTIQHYEELRKMPFADSVFQSDMLRQSFITTIQSFLELLLEDLGGNNER